ncbi:MAG: ABC transporter permease [Mesotoga sp.]|jgi:lipoprotein-releasing system permease protein|uniref:ABC transporter permease n=1 Tax=unclassified Mesotoga TaxID=1184398 RepID=UPI000EF226D5|nr:FtsX-like permease family protein [Mesotoga sp.]MDI9368871.1 ABC transporter permease [Thermotogota bacterium]NLT44764.1 ABC transporter permease [Thermotogaceae bacterium]RLL83746.1 permease [Mesotoga sp. BH458_6_3_2_1]MDD2334429.1 ABC transporter permease [Mesotoga sp.]MDD3681789.1 ABC transporter permease [Mesotoga sp.]
MRLAFSIAMRFLSSSKAQTLLIVLGIAIGVSVQVFIGSLIQGLQKDLVDTTIGSSSQITVSSTENNGVEEWQNIVSEIASIDLPTDLTALSASADVPVFISSGDRTLSVLLRGLQFPESHVIYKTDSRLIDGSLPEGDGEIIIGKGLEDELDVNLGEEITIFTPDRTVETLKVVGVFDLGVASLNKNWLISTIGTAQSVGKLGDAVTSIEMQVSEVFRADENASVISERLSTSALQVTNWKSQNEDLLSGLNGQSVSSIMIQVFVIIAVSLGIASVLAITVVQKSRQIGILKAMGLKDSTTSFVFLFQGLALGVVGAVVGIAFGILLIIMFSTFAVGTDGEPIIRISLSYGFVMLSALIAIGASTIAAMVPARRSSKLSPVEVIRNG